MENRDRDSSVYTISSEQGFSNENKIANQSTDYLVQISSRASVFQKKNFYRNAVIVLTICVIVLLLGFVIIIALYLLYGSHMFFNASNICTSEECLRSAANLRLSIDLSVDPCEDFYKFTCGRWNEEHPNHGWFSHFSSFETADERIAFATLRFLTSNESKDEPLPVKQSRYLYASCMDRDSLDKLGYDVIYKYLKKVDLPTIPHYFTKGNGDNFKFDWLKAEVIIKKIFAMDMLLGFAVEGDIYNRSNSVIYMGVPTTGNQLPRYFRRKKLGISKRDSSDGTFGNDEHNNNNTDEDDDDGEDDKDSQNVVLIAERVMEILFKDIGGDSFTTGEIKTAAEAIRNFTSEVEKLTDGNYTDDENLDYEVFRVDHLQQLTDECLKKENLNPVANVWRRYLMMMFEDVKEIVLDLDGKDFIHVSVLELEYLCNILSLVSKTPDEILELYYWWVTVNSMIISTTSEMSDYIWKLVTPRAIVDRSRAIDCASLVVTYMGVAVSYGIADKSFLNHTKPKVERMLGEIKAAFVERVNELTWMDESTKKATLQKSEEMVSFIGFPEWFLEDGCLEEYYGKMTIKNNTYLENMINIIEKYTLYQLKQLGKESERDWRTEPTTVNAYNYFSDNSITVPMAILTFPFYNLGLEVLNYGAIGSILGHELTHGFDITGRKFDKFGNYRQWWSNRTIQTFEEKTECFVKQYENYTVPPLNEKVDGKRTLGENLADNGGLHHAYIAYQRYKKKHPPEKFLPGLQNFSTEQLFFIAYGSIWCEELNINSIEYQIKNDEHSPNYARVLGTLQNSYEFSKAFNCPLGSKMNPSGERCRIW